MKPSLETLTFAEDRCQRAAANDPIVGAAWRAANVRSLRERVIQTLWFEALGLAIVSPLFALFAGATVGDSFAFLAVLSIVVMLWSALYNTLFDLIELHVAGRVASDRPHHRRVLHALALEASAVIVTWPLVVALTPLSWREALPADIGLTLVYAVYGNVFHLVFDRLRPVRVDGAAPSKPLQRDHRGSMS